MRFNEKGRYLRSVRRAGEPVHRHHDERRRSSSTPRSRPATATCCGSPTEHCLTTRRYLVRGDGSDVARGHLRPRDRRVPAPDDPSGLARRRLLGARAGLGALRLRHRLPLHRRPSASWTPPQRCADFYIERTPATRLVPPNDWEEPDPIQPVRKLGRGDRRRRALAAGRAGPATRSRPRLRRLRADDPRHALHRTTSWPSRRPAGKACSSTAATTSARSWASTSRSCGATTSCSTRSTSSRARWSSATSRDQPRPPRGRLDFLTDLFAAGSPPVATGSTPTRSTATSRSSARAWAARRWPGRCATPGRGCWWSSAATSCPARRQLVPEAVFLEARYKNAEAWQRRHGDFQARRATTTSAATPRSTAPACRVPRRGLRRAASTGRHLARVAVRLRRARAVLRRRRAALSRPRHGGRRPDRAMALGRVPVPRRCRTNRRSRRFAERPREAGPRPFLMPVGVDLGAKAALHPLPHLRRLPCRLDAKGDADVRRAASCLGSGGSVAAAHPARTRTAASNPTAGRVALGMVSRGRAAAGAGRAVRRRPAAPSTPPRCCCARRTANPGSGQQLRTPRAQLHGPRQTFFMGVDPRRRTGRLPEDSGSTTGTGPAGTPTPTRSATCRYSASSRARCQGRPAWVPLPVAGVHARPQRRPVPDKRGPSRAEQPDRDRARRRDPRALEARPTCRHTASWSAGRPGARGAPATRWSSPSAWASRPTRTCAVPR